MDRAAVRLKRMQRDCVPRLPHLDQGEAQIRMSMTGLWVFSQCNARKREDVTEVEGIDRGVANDSEPSIPLAASFWSRNCTWCWRKLEGIWKFKLR